MKTLTLTVDDVLAERIESVANRDGRTVPQTIELLLLSGLEHATNDEPCDASRVGDITVKQLAALLGVSDLEAARSRARETSNMSDKAHESVMKLFGHVEGLRVVHSLVTFRTPQDVDTFRTAITLALASAGPSGPQVVGAFAWFDPKTNEYRPFSGSAN